MQILTQIVVGAKGLQDLEVKFVPADNNGEYTVRFDAATCRKVAAILVEQADAMERSIIVPNGKPSCRACMGLSTDFNRLASFVGGQWIHAHVSEAGCWMSCANPPTALPGE